MKAMKAVRYMTRGVALLVEENPTLLDQIMEEFGKAASKVDDWFYSFSIQGQQFFVCDNGEDGYTVMLPEEY